MKRIMLLGGILFLTIPIVRGQEKRILIYSQSASWNKDTVRCCDVPLPSSKLATTCYTLVSLTGCALFPFSPWPYIFVPLSTLNTLWLGYQLYQDRVASGNLCTVPFHEFRHALVILLASSPSAFNKYTASNHMKHYREVSNVYAKLNYFQKALKNGVVESAFQKRSGKYLPQEIVDLIFNHAIDACIQEQNELTIFITQEELYPIIKECGSIGNYSYATHTQEL